MRGRGKDREGGFGALPRRECPPASRASTAISDTTLEGASRGKGSQRGVSSASLSRRVGTCGPAERGRATKKRKQVEKLAILGPGRGGVRVNIDNRLGDESRCI